MSVAVMNGRAINAVDLKALPQSGMTPWRRPRSRIPAGVAHRSAGAFMVDLLRARGISTSSPDAMAEARLRQTRAVADQKTTDTPGILPTPITGTIVSLIDANRPLCTSLGVQPASMAGTSFTRPKITQHTSAGQQVSGEKTALASQKMTISPVTFTKTTYGGTVDISRQDIDWSSPSAWDALLSDLGAVYSVQTETAVAAAFAAAANTNTPVVVGTSTLANWASALYQAGMHSYQASRRMPNRVWISLDVWAGLGSLLDTTRVVLPQDVSREMGAPGTSSLRDFAGDLFGLPRIGCPPSPLAPAWSVTARCTRSTKRSSVSSAWSSRASWECRLPTAATALTPPSRRTG